MRTMLREVKGQELPQISVSPDVPQKKSSY
jgi:hypothetical protein